MTARVIETQVLDGALVEWTLEGDKGNVLDLELVTRLREAAQRAAERPELRAVLLRGAGGRFSFGASVEDHLPGRIAEFLPAFHSLFRQLHRMRLPLLAAIEGPCLGGGLELAAMAHRIFAAPDARLGCPEVKLGVFAPLGSLLLPRRIGGAADDLLVTGRVVDAEEALRLGLVDEIAEDPAEAARRFAQEHFVPLSGRAVRFAAEAARRDFDDLLGRRLEDLERLYLEELMAGEDAEEGIRAFLEKRSPRWSHR